MRESHVTRLILLDQALAAVTLPSSHQQQRGYINLTMTDGLGFEGWSCISERLFLTVTCPACSSPSACIRVETKPMTHRCYLLAILSCLPLMKSNFGVSAYKKKDSKEMRQPPFQLSVSCMRALQGKHESPQSNTSSVAPELRVTSDLHPLWTEKGGRA